MEKISGNRSSERVRTRLARKTVEEYRFRLVDSTSEGPLQDPALLSRRPQAGIGRSFQEDARRFVCGEQLETAINTAIAVGEPLLITGEPGTGKTQVAYFVAYKLGAEPVLRFQTKSDSSAQDLLYNFDMVRYFRDAHLSGDESGPIDKSQYVERRPLWEAIVGDAARVLLVDEIDKAPRDFPNDLLHELDKMEISVPETGATIRGHPANRPIVIITSNSERRLPEPFLRRCVYHHIVFDRKVVEKAVEIRRDEYSRLSDGFLQLAIQRFLALREQPLRKSPSTAELLVWLRVLGLSVGTYSEQLDSDLSRLPYLGTLIKDHQDREDLVRQDRLG